ncbi:MAG: acyl-CoA thioesterase domain-containing protein, partial [Phenylobacterium sp.]
MQNQPFFTKDGTNYVPTDASRGPWNPNSLHGRVMVGLLGHEIERLHGGPDYMPARLTVDMYRLPDLSAVEVTTRVVKDGYRIKVIDAEFISGGVSAGRATCQLLRRTENPAGRVWTPEPWQVPKPADIPVPDDPRAGMGGMWTMRPITGG